VTNNVLVRDVATVKRGTMPGEVDRYNMKRIVSLTANIQGDELGDVSKAVNAAIREAGAAPKGVSIDTRGQVTPYEELFQGLAFGLLLAIVVIALMLLAYFQSARLAFVAVAPIPAALVGVLLALLLTGSTLNLQSFMGAIMAVGVATANAILLVTFAEKARISGLSALAAAEAGAQARVRPILMTSCAMIAGMLPMALGLGDGGDQSAPLARAVIGGLALATLCTLFILPALFAFIMGRAGTGSASLNPFDPASRHSTNDAILTTSEQPPHAH